MRQLRIDQDAVARLQPVLLAVDMEQHLARQHVAMLLAGMGDRGRHALGARKDEMEDLQPVERRTAAEMAEAIAGGGDVLQPAVGAMDRDPRPGRRAGALEQLMQAKPQHLGELDQVGDRGHRLAALEPRQKAFRQAGLAGH